MLILVILPILFGVTNSFPAAGKDCKERKYFNGILVSCSNGDVKFVPKPPNSRFKWGVVNYSDISTSTRNRIRYES